MVPLAASPSFFQVAEVKEPIVTDDYFRRNAEFAAFMAEERGVPFNGGSAPTALSHSSQRRDNTLAKLLVIIV
jgi:hypothetical protein